MKLEDIMFERESKSIKYIPQSKIIDLSVLIEQFILAKVKRDNLSRSIQFYKRRIQELEQELSIKKFDKSNLTFVRINIEVCVEQLNIRKKKYIFWNGVFNSLNEKGKKEIEEVYK